MNTATRISCNKTAKGVYVFIIIDIIKCLPLEGGGVGVVEGMMIMAVSVPGTGGFTLGSGLGFTITVKMSV